MGLLLNVLDHVPASWIRAAGAVRGKSRVIKRMTDWLPDMVRNHEGRIQKGLGRGLRFNGGESAVGFLLGTHDLEVQFAFHRLLQPGMVAYDIGANVGFTALLAAKQVGPTGQVFCFEPLADNAQRIQHNADLNGFCSISVRQLALGAEDGEAEFQCSDAPTWGRLAGAGAAPMAAASLKVPVRSLDSLVANDGLPMPEFIKMDVEGAEASVLRGSSTLLGRARPILVIELHHTYYDVAKALEGRNYTVHMLTPGVTSIDDEFQLLAIPREKSELNQRWSAMAAEKWEFA
jgi:FkbM family methyltransferase